MLINDFYRLDTVVVETIIGNKFQESVIRIVKRETG